MATTTARSVLRTAFAGACLLFVLTGCSGDDSPLVVPTDPAGSDVEGDTEATGVGRQASAPGVGRVAGEPGPEQDPILHVLGSIRSIADPAVPPSETLPLITTDQATVASIACAPSECPSSDVAPWAIGQIEVLNVATQDAASEGNGQLGGYVDDLEALGVSTVGYGQNIDEAVEPFMVRSNGKRIAIHAISLDPTNPAQATDSAPGIAGRSALDALRQDIIANRNDGFGVVVLVDWGNNSDRAPGVDQIGDVEQLAEAGADAVIGHGSDFLLRFDLVDQTAVAYGLGNSSVSEVEPLRADTAILRLEFTTPGRSCLLPATASANGPSLDNPAAATCSTG